METLTFGGEFFSAVILFTTAVHFVRSAPIQSLFCVCLLVFTIRRRLLCIIIIKTTHLYQSIFF